MTIDDDACYRAVQSRDARFDGKFFTGVTSTGIYCRPVCPAKTPRRDHVRFFASAAAAEQEGFRPCKRCRPETAPETPVWRGTATSVTRGMRLVAEGFLEEHSLTDLAERLGMGTRHLRRLFVHHVGVAPKLVEQVRRSHLAALLLRESSLSVTEVAFASGFRSVRQFNAAVRRSFDRSPSELRGAGDTGAISPQTRLRLAYRPPFDWKGILEFLAARAVSGVEAVEKGVYLRTLSRASDEELSTVSHDAERYSLILSTSAPARDLASLVARVRTMFDLRADPQEIACHLEPDPILRGLVARFPGNRIPVCPDPFEAALRAVLGQQVSVKAQLSMLARLVQLCEPTGGQEDTRHRLPSPEQLLEVDLGRLGMPDRRRNALKAVARAWLDGTVPAGGGASLEELVEALTSLPGVGPWTAHYVALRGFGEPDAFPAADLGLRVAAGRLLGRGEAISAGELTGIAEAWKPWRGYAALLLWRSLSTDDAPKRKKKT